MHHYLRFILVLTFLISQPSTANDLHTSSCELLFNLGMYDNAISQCQQEAERGNSSAALNLSAIFTAQGNNESAIQWLKQGTELGNKDATYNLAYAYLHGIHVSIDKQRAIELYKKAATLGNLQAQFELAEMMSQTNQAPENALSFYRNAAQEGHPPSQIKLAQHYLDNGQTLKAMEWLHKAAHAGNTDAMYMLGVALQESNPERSLHWYKQSASRGNPFAKHNLARLYMSGKQVKKDYAMALSLVDEAISAGITQSTKLKREIRRRMESPSSTSLSRTRDWIFNQPKNLYVLQLGAFHSEKNAIRFIKKNGLDSTSYYYPSKHKSERIFIVLNGPYDSRKNAIKSIATLSKNVRKSRPYPKSFEMIHTRRQY